MVPLVIMLIWVGSASNVASFTLPVLPACAMPDAAPCAVMTFAAKAPARLGFAVMSPSMNEVAVPTLSASSFCSGSSLIPGNLAAISASKPATRASVVDTPLATLITATVPLPLSRLPSVSAASRPPAALFEEIRDSPIA